MRNYFIIFLILLLSGQLFSLEAHSQQTTLYLVRHGQTDWNVQGKLQGHADIPLNKAGRAEAVGLSEKISEIDFDICFSSDLQRAIETARILGATRPLTIKTVPALRERNFGLWEGRLFSELLEYEKGGQPFPNIESDGEIQKRIFPLLNEIASSYPGATVLIVTHGGVIRSLVAHLLNIDSSSILSIQMKTMATLQLVASNGQYEIREMTDIQIHADGKYGN
ncbi:MAG TPA: histidine phosphatase family protein [Rhabdochlamydiaceae bacterium]|jgi:probable phosphoglycerate mutase